MGRARASHEDRTEPKPDAMLKNGDDPDRSRHSKVSGGGGGADVHHAHSPAAKRNFEAGSDEKQAHKGG